MTLIERLEAATGPDRELANEVLLACGWTAHVTPTRMVTYWVKNPDAFPDGEQPNPLASIDAALTLVPDGWEWALTWHDERARFELGDPRLFNEGDAPTTPLAICIACLKARGMSA